MGPFPGPMGPPLGKYFASYSLQKNQSYCSGYRGRGRGRGRGRFPRGGRPRSRINTNNDVILSILSQLFIKICLYLFRITKIIKPMNKLQINQRPKENLIKQEI